MNKIMMNKIKRKLQRTSTKEIKYGIKHLTRKSEEAINMMIDKCKNVGMKYIYCDSINPIAIALYKSLGFIEYKVEEEKSYLKLNL